MIPNPFDNTILVQGTPQDIEQIKTLLAQLDLPPRQVLIDCKIYEVDLDNEFAEGVQSYLQRVGSSSATSVTGNSAPPALPTLRGLTPASALAAGRRTWRPGSYYRRHGVEEQPVTRRAERVGNERQNPRDLRAQHHRYR